MGKTRDLFKKIRDTKGTFHAQMDLIYSSFSGFLRWKLQRRQWYPTPVLSPGKSHGWRSLVGCSPWGHQESDMTGDFTFNFHFPALEKEMATHSSVLALRIGGTGEPGGLPFMGLHRVIHDWSNLAAAAARWRLRLFMFFYFSIICNQCYKFPSKYRFHCIPQILISCGFIFI